jgi:bacillithiol system protein YtxJ
MKGAYLAPLSRAEQLDELDALSHSRPVLIFKHSTRCSISSTALGRMRAAGQEGVGAETAAYLLDLLAHRDISNAIAERYGVEHESPQVIVIRNGTAVFHASHLSIFPGEIRKIATAV